MWIQQLSHFGKRRRREYGEYLARSFQVPSVRIGAKLGRVSPVDQCASRRVPVLFEADESGIVTIGAAHIKFLEPTTFSILDGSPEEKNHPAQIVISRVRATILIDHRFLASQSDDARNIACILRCNPNLDPFPQTIDQIAEPCERLRRHRMAPIGDEEKPIESLYLLLAPALSVCQALTFGAAYFSLNGILVKRLVK